MMDSNRFMDADIQDLLRNPNKFGAPTLKQFMKDPDHWRKQKAHLFNMIDNGPKTIQGLKKMVIYVDGIVCNNLEHAERVMSDLGLTQDDLEMKPEIKDIGNHQCEIHVYMVRKQTQSNLILPEGLR